MNTGINFINFNDILTDIEENVFQNCNLSTITFSKYISTIKSGAFTGNNIRQLTFSTPPLNIDNDAFDTGNQISIIINTATAEQRQKILDIFGSNASIRGTVVSELQVPPSPEVTTTTVPTTTTTTLPTMQTVRPSFRVEEETSSSTTTEPTTTTTEPTTTTTVEPTTTTELITTTVIDESKVESVVFAGNVFANIKISDIDSGRTISDMMDSLKKQYPEAEFSVDTSTDPITIRGVFNSSFTNIEHFANDDIVREFQLILENSPKEITDLSVEELNEELKNIIIYNKIKTRRTNIALYVFVVLFIIASIIAFYMYKK